MCPAADRSTGGHSPSRILLSQRPLHLWVYCYISGGECKCVIFQPGALAGGQLRALERNGLDKTIAQRPWANRTAHSPPRSTTDPR